MTHEEHPESQGQSRRSFLGQAAVLAGATSLIGAAAGKASARVAFAEPGKAAERTPLKDGETIRIGVIGPGGMGTGHIHSFCDFAAKKQENIEIVALADVCDSRFEDGKKRCEETFKNKVDTYRDYRQLLARKDIHAVIIASPEHWHAQHATDSILAGKDVYCEKPMCFLLDESIALMKLSLANPQVVFQVGTQKMQLKKYQEAKKLIDAGAIGTPTFSQTSYCRNSKDGEWLYYAIDPKWDPKTNIDWNAWLGSGPKIPWNPDIYARWRRYRDWSTGIVGDLLVHEITPLVMALESVGWPVRVMAAGSHLVDKKMENHDQCNLTIEFESGHIMTVAGSTCNESGVETMIRGHQANLYLADRHCTLRPERLFADSVDEKKVECPDIGNDQDVHRKNWLHCIRTREKPLADAITGAKVMTIVSLATRSMWEKSAFVFDPKTFTAKKA
jgi:predicted dehydrogenase